jgi:hypothetical protein
LWHIQQIGNQNETKIRFRSSRRTSAVHWWNSNDTFYNSDRFDTRTGRNCE